LVSSSQSAFVKKRCIHDNFILIQGIAKELHRKKTPALFLKLDIAKAFDSISWEYPLEVLERLGFGARWRSEVEGLDYYGPCFFILENTFKWNTRTTD
jgi:hypothetical protein